jgi:hypothetical protein
LPEKIMAPAARPPITQKTFERLSAWRDEIAGELAEQEVALAEAAAALEVAERADHDRRLDYSEISAALRAAGDVPFLIGQRLEDIARELKALASAAICARNLRSGITQRIQHLNAALQHVEISIASAGSSERGHVGTVSRVSKPADGPFNEGS